MQSPCLTLSVPGVTSRDGLVKQGRPWGPRNSDLGPLKPVSASGKAHFQAVGPGAPTRWAWRQLLWPPCRDEEGNWITKSELSSREAKWQCQLWIQGGSAASFSLDFPTFKQISYHLLLSFRWFFSQPWKDSNRETEADKAPFQPRPGVMPRV